MSVTSLGTPTQVRATAGSITATWGTGQVRTAGDLLVAVVSATATTSTAAMSTPAGWTKQLEIGNTTTARARVALYTKTAAGADAAPVITSTISGTATMTCTMFELVSALGVNVSGTYASGATAASLTAMTATTSANVSHTGGYAVSAFAQEASASTNTWNSGTGWTNATTDGTTLSTGHAAVDFQANPAAGAALAETGHWTTNATAFGAGLVVVFAATSPLVSTLVDALTSGSMNTTLWSAFGSSNISWASSELSISSVANTANNYSGITSNATYNLTGSSAYVRLVSAGNQSIASWQGVFMMQLDANNDIDYIVGGGNLTVQKHVAGTYTQLSTVAYNTSTMKWLRIRELSGTTFFDYSADGTTWTNWYSVANFIAVTTLVVTLEGGTFATETLVGTLVLQDFNSTAAVPVTLTNNLEGGTDGTTITTVNSGGASGNAFDNVVIGTGATATYSATHAAHGGLGLAVSTGSTAATALCRWDSSLGVQTTLYGRTYLYVTGAPSSSDSVIEFQNASASRGGIQITTGLQWLVQDAAFATLYTSTHIIPIGQWVRVEWEIVFSATAGQAIVNYYESFDSTTPTETFTSSTTQNFGAGCDTMIFGWSTAHSNQPLLYFDDLGVSTVGFLGPVVTGSSGGSTALASNNFEGGTTGTTITTANSGGASGTAFTAVTIGTTASATFSNVHAAHGNLGLVVATGTTSSNAQMQWGSTVLGTLTTIYGRAYFYTTAAPGANDAVVQFQSSGASVCGFQITTGSQWLVQDAAFTYIHTFTSVIPTGQWVRIEWKVIFSATVGQVILNYYATADSTTVTESYTSPATQNFGASINTANFGWNNAHVSQPTMYLDDLALSTTGFLGPAVISIKSSDFLTFFA
jgi:hypothetical protein